MPLASAGPLVLPADLLALVTEHAGRTGMQPVDWLARAIRAHAKVPATAAERKRASRARHASVTKGGTS